MTMRILRLCGAILLLSLTIVGCQLVRNSGDTAVTAARSTNLRVATYNVHYIILSKQTGAWSVGDWDRRKEPMDQAFKAINADVIAFQEMESFARGSGGQTNLTLDWLLANNPSFAAAAVGDPADFPSTQPILYRQDRLEQTDQGWFFFSDTPDVIYARTYNGSFPAFASWAAFRDTSTNEAFRVVNIHTDYASRSNREQSAALVAERIAPWIAANETVLVVGDFNARAGNKVLRTIEDVGVNFAPVRGSTYHFNRGINLFGAIDHIGVSGRARFVGEPVVLRRKFAGEWPTDHYPLFVDITF